MKKWIGEKSMTCPIPNRQFFKATLGVWVNN